MLWLILKMWWALILAFLLGVWLAPALARRASRSLGEEASAELAAARTRHQEAEADRARLKARAMDLEQQLAAAQNQRDAFEARIETAEGEADRLRDAAETGDVDALAEALARADRLQTELRLLRERVGPGSAGGQLVAYDAEADAAALRKRVVELEARLAARAGDRGLVQRVSAEPAAAAGLQTFARDPRAAPPIRPAAGGGRDDLKRIRGIGPKLESVLNGMGITTYAEIASWTEARVDEIDEKLHFHGRIRRDGWVEQARRLNDAV